MDGLTDGISPHSTGHQTPLVGPETPLTDPQTHLVGPKTPTARPQIPPTGRQTPCLGGRWMRDGWMDGRTEFLPILHVSI